MYVRYPQITVGMRRMVSPAFIHSCMAESQQVQRVVRILTALSSGRKLTTAELAERVAESNEGKCVSRRQIQRDLRAIEAAGVPLCCQQEGRTNRWWVPATYRTLTPLTVSTNEILSLHVLKGFLQQFRGTQVEQDVVSLAQRLEGLAPGTVLLDSELLQVVTPGQVTEEVPAHILNMVISSILEQSWTRVTYRALHDDNERSYVVALCRLISHAGRLYVAAWHPKYRNYMNLAADRIIAIEEDPDCTLPLHQFNEELYRNSHFGVHSGPIHAVTIRVNNTFADFFTSRTWHPSQHFTHTADGALLLNLTAPVNPELAAWIASWRGKLEPLSPPELVAMVNAGPANG